MKVIPIHTTNTLEIFAVDASTPLPLHYVSGGVSAGFPSPADDFLENSLDLNKHLIPHPSSTFYAKVRGSSMKNAGLDDGDTMIVDKSLEPKNDDIAVCWIDGDFTVKRILKDKDAIWLVPENEDYKPIKVTSDNDLVIWGIVTHVIKSFR